MKHHTLLCLCGLLVFVVLCRDAGAETLIDDFSTPNSAFGNRDTGEGLYDVPFNGAGFARSRDMDTLYTPAGSLPAEVDAGQLVITDLAGSGSTAAVYVIYDSVDGSALLGQPMPGGPVDLSRVTEFRIDASGVTGDMYWAFGIAYWSGSSFVNSVPLVNGINAIPASAINAFADYTNVHAIFLAVVNRTPGTPGSATLDDFRIDLVTPAGDTDLDGDVDDADLGTAFSTFSGPVGAAGNLSRLEGDADGDGDVDDADMAVAFSGYTGPLTPGDTVPEPGSVVFVGVGGLWMLRRGRGMLRVAR